MKQRHRYLMGPVLACLVAGCAAPDPYAAPSARLPAADRTSADDDLKGTPVAQAVSVPSTPSRNTRRAAPLADAPPPLAPPAPARRAAATRTAPALPPVAVSPAVPATPPRPAPSNRNDVVSLNFVDTDIPAVLRVLARFTQRNFLVDPRVKGKLTLVSEQPVPSDTAYSMLLGALRMQGFTVVDVNGVSRVVPEADAKLQGGAVAGSGQPGGGIVTRTFRLNYETAADLVPVLRPMIAPNNPITAYPGNNTLVITDYADNLDRIAKIIANVDTPTSLDTDVVKMRNGIAVDVAAMAQQLLDTQSKDPAQRIVVVADPRANSIVVRASSPARTRLARELIAKLDESQEDPGNLHVVYLRNAQSMHLARVLRGLLTGETDATSGALDPVRASLGTASSGGGGGLSGGTRTSGSGSYGSQGQSTSGPSGLGASGSMRSSLNGGASGAAGGASGSTMDSQQSMAFSANGTTVQADASTNTLIISAPEPMYRSLRKVIDLLDQRRAQVLIESLIVEVTETNAAQLGIQWMAGNPTRVFGGTRFPSAPGLNANAGTTIDALPGGLNIGVINGNVSLPGIGEIINLKMLATALQTQGGTNILSTPNLLTLDNEPASIMVGKTVPFVSGQYVTSGSGSDNPFQTVEREDVGLKLNVRPQISEGGTVKLDIYQEVSSIDEALSSSAGIVTNKRALDTSVLLEDGQIMVLGGLLEDTVTTGREAVPVLGSIPVLGALFRYDTRQRAKTNLMVFLRPYVVRDARDSRGLTQTRYDFMRRAQGVSQPGSHLVLPDMGAPILPPSGVSTTDETPYDLRPRAQADTMRREGPEVEMSSELRQRPADPDQQDRPDRVRTNLPAGLTISTDPAAMYGQTEETRSVLQFADVTTDQEAQRIMQRARISGLKSYMMTGPGGMGYVVRADVPRDPRAVDNAVAVLRELGYQPEIVVAP
ncbi:general secretion pathway protein D [Bordetella ansorpii]|uniref:General secretion pathway protein D n=1 Tax=Bordetella ansorpii TaxID=288768 RepID=A0A157SF87_9BORD|nr:type II secretion system secretin GspD [Bordetella ansorpii]SAI69110.1 general secretion pathway protein D [Bordetella ansorpii]